MKTHDSNRTTLTLTKSLKDFKKHKAVIIVSGCIIIAAAVIGLVPSDGDPTTELPKDTSSITVAETSQVTTVTTTQAPIPELIYSDVTLKNKLESVKEGIPPIESEDDVFTKTTTTTSSVASVTSDTSMTSKKKKKKKKKSSKKSISTAYQWDGPVLNSFAGLVAGPSGNETFYNLDMSGVISIMQSQGYNYEFWIREDGVKMFGDYVMVAADLSIRPRGSLIPTSLGMGIVCDTGSFVSWDPTRLDIATTW